VSNSILLIGAGFAGRAILPHLAKLYDNVHVISRSKCYFNDYKNIHIYVGQLDDEKLLNKLLPVCNTILYYAWDSTPGKTALKPQFEFNANLIPLVRFLEILQHYSNRHLFFLSSGGTVYGNTASKATTEDQPFHPRSYYAASKISSEAFITAFGRQTDNQITILRPSNFYGIGQPYIKGFGLIRTVFEHLLKNTPVEIWGDGTAKRDYLYIEDFVSANLLLLNQDPISNVQIFNVSSSCNASINKICESIENISGRHINKIYKPTRSVDLFNISIDSNQLRSLGWAPSTDLTKGLTYMWEWLCKTQTPAINQ
jgi:UDP-glucose 4-epimerase